MLIRIIPALTAEQLDIIHKIKSFEKPPEKEGDTYYTRSPWCKLGGYNTEGNIMPGGWYWFKDSYIAELGINDNDLQLAVKEMRAAGYDI